MVHPPLAPLILVMDRDSGGCGVQAACVTDE